MLLHGWPVGKLVKFGAKAYALRKSWQARYAPWREVREEVTVLGPDVFSSLTSAGYYVRSTSTGRCFFTDDVLLPETSPALENQEPETTLYLPERDPQAPVRRHRRKSAPQWHFRCCTSRGSKRSWSIVHTVLNLMKRRNVVPQVIAGPWVQHLHLRAKAHQG